MKLLSGNGEQIIIQDNSLCSGGEAGIHRVISPNIYKDVVAKIYLPSYGTDANGKKDMAKIHKQMQRIQYMVANNPFVYSRKEIKETFTWPIDILLDQSGVFVGFLLTFVSDSIAVNDLVLGIGLPIKWQNFETNNSKSYNNRLMLCYNIAQALSEMHKSGTYTLVDFKPDNIMLKNNGYVAIIDMDSIQIATRGKVLFHATACTPDFAPPEFHHDKADFTCQYIYQSWDCFSFATIAYLLLINSHPFGNMIHATNETIHSIVDFIKGGYFAFGDKQSSIELSHIHNNYSKIGPNLQYLFSKCFVSGHTNPNSRPSIAEWRDAIADELQRIYNTPISVGVFQPRPRVKVNPLLKILDFSFNVIFNSIELSWKTSGASFALLDKKKVPTSGAITIPLLKGEHILEIEDGKGCYLNKRLNISHLSFFNKIIAIYNRSSITLEWNAVNATGVTIDNKAVASKGNMVVPIKTKTYHFVARDINGATISRDYPVIVHPIIKRFDVVYQPYSAILTWDVWHADSCVINGSSVPLVGSVSVPLFSCDYCLKVSDLSGNSVELSVFVQGDENQTMLTPRSSIYNTITMSHAQSDIIRPNEMYGSIDM